jgi:hypothetical protein
LIVRPSMTEGQSMLEQVIPTAFEADSFCGFTNRLISDSRLAGPGGGNASSSSIAR